MIGNRRTPRLSIAIGPDMLTAVTAEGTIHRVSRPAPGDGARAPLAESFRELARSLGMESASLDVAVMPPLSEVRLVALPPLKPAEAEAIIRRDVSKHFTVSNEHRVIGVRVPKRRSGAAAAGDETRPAPILAAAASQNLLDEISAAAMHTGWKVGRIVPAHAAWLQAAMANAAREGTLRPRAFVAIDGDTAFIMRIENGVPADLRRLPSTHTDAIAGALGATTGTVLVFGGAGHPGLTAALSAAGWSVLPSADSADVAAARNAPGAEPMLLSASLHAVRYARQRTLANRLFAAAIVLLVLAAGVAQWGASRELNAIRAKRAAIRPRVQPLLAMRDSVDALDARTRETDALFASQSRWSRTLYEITMLLPEDAHLTRLNATGDTIVIEGEAARAGDALEAIGRAPTLRNVHMEGPVQRDLADGSTTSERFVIQGSLANATPAKSSKSQRRVNAPKSSGAAEEAAALGRQP